MKGSGEVARLTYQPRPWPGNAVPDIPVNVVCGLNKAHFLIAAVGLLFPQRAIAVILDSRSDNGAMNSGGVNGTNQLAYDVVQNTEAVPLYLESSCAVNQGIIR